MVNLPIDFFIKRKIDCMHLIFTLENEKKYIITTNQFQNQL